MGRLCLALLAGLLCACSRPKPVLPRNEPGRPGAKTHYPSAVGVPGCTLYGVPRQTGTVPAELGELSGLAASARHPGIFWAHNDADSAFQRVRHRGQREDPRHPHADGRHADGRRGHRRGPLRAPGPGAHLPLPGGHRGQLPARRRRCACTACPSPSSWRTPRSVSRRWRSPTRTGPTTPRRSSSTRARAGWPSSPRRRTRWGRCTRWTGARVNDTVKAVKLGTLRAPQDLDRLTTAAALHPSGERLLLRTYTRVWEVRRPQAPAAGGADRGRGGRGARRQPAPGRGHRLHA